MGKERNKLLQSYRLGLLSVFLFSVSFHHFSWYRYTTFFFKQSMRNTVFETLFFKSVADTKTLFAKQSVCSVSFPVSKKHFVSQTHVLETLFFKLEPIHYTDTLFRKRMFLKLCFSNWRRYTTDTLFRK